MMARTPVRSASYSYLLGFVFVIGALAGCGGSGAGGGAGNAGTAGTTGVAGTTGSAGTTGGAGTTGAAGTTAGAGTTGSAGLTGTAGTTGAAGTGAAGAGTAGTMGAAGTGAAGTGTAGAGGAAAGATGTAGSSGGGGIEAIDVTTPAPSTGCGMAPDLTGTSLNYSGMTVYKKGVSYTGKGGTAHMGEYLIALPNNYAMATPYKLAFSMGGYTRDALDCLFGDCWGFADAGHKAGAIVVTITQTNPGPLHPPQTADPNNAPVKTGWELSNELEDNVALFKAVKADILAKYCVDTKHVFVTGGSSGADMAQYLGCWLGDELRGVASVGGCMANTIAPVAGTSPMAAPARGQETPENICLKTLSFGVCKGNVAVLMVHGFKDPHIPWADARLTRDAWVPKNGCGPGPTTPMTLDAVHTMISTGGANKITCVDAPTCAMDYPVRWCEHSEGGYDGSTHGWPSNVTSNPDGAGKYIWDFWSSLR